MVADGKRGGAHVTRRDPPSFGDASEGGAGYPRRFRMPDDSLPPAETCLHNLHRMGLGSAHTREEREALGFFVCEADLEDELIRALGTEAVERVLESEGELESFRRFQDQPAQRGRSTHAHLRRFMGTRARRKIRYGSLLVNALQLERVPRALDLVLTHHRK